MPMRMGEMMVVVRAQDFASRTLRRVSGELAGMSRAQQLGRAADISRIQSATQLDRLLRASAVRGNLQILEKQVAVENQLATARSKVAASSAGLAFPMRSSIVRKNLDDLNRLTLVNRGLEDQIRTMPMPMQRMQGNMDKISEASRRAAINQKAAGVGLKHSAENVHLLSRAINRLPIDKLDEVGHAMGGIGRTMQLFGAVSTAALGLSAGAFASFQRNVTLAATQTRQAGESFVQTAVNADRLGVAIRDMMMEFPAGADDMAKAAYDIYSSIDVNFTSGIKLLRLFNKAAVAGGVDLQTATSASITVLENFDKKLVATGKTSDDTSNIMNRMFAIVRYGRMNFEQFNDMLNSVVPAAVGAQQSFDDVAGAMAFLTRHIPSQSRAATSLSRMIDVFIDPDFQAGMKKAGLAIEDTTGKLLPLPEILDRIAALKPKRLNEIIRNITAFGRGTGRGREYTIQARRAMTQYIKHLDEYHRVQAAVVGDNDEFTNSFLAMSQTLGVRWQVFMNQLKVLILYIGEEALPVFVDIGEQISDWIDKWQSLSDETRGTIIRWGVIISVGTLVAGVLAAIVGSLVTLTAWLLRAGPGIASVTGKLGKLLVSLRGLAGIGAIVLGIELMQKGGLWTKLGPILAAAGLGFMRGGAAGAAAAAILTIGVELQFMGSGWQSKLGQILMGAGAGALLGGAPGAVIGGAIATIQVAIDQRGAEQDLYNIIQTFTRRADEVARTLATAQNTTFENARKQVEQQVRDMMRAQGLSGGAGLQAATEWLNNFENKIRRTTGPRDAFDGLMRDASKSIPNVDQKMSLREALKSAKSFTEIMDIVEQQTSNVAGNAEKIATQIAMAYSRGNFAKASTLLDQFIRDANRKITGANVFRLITDAVKSGDIQGAISIMNEWNSLVQQSEQEWKDYAQAVKNYQQQITDTTKQANQDIIDSMRQMYMTLLGENEQAMGQLFQGPWLTSETFNLAQEWGITPAIDDMILDLKQQNDKFKQWRQSLDKLMKRGLPRDFINELRKMGPEEGQSFLDEIIGASPKQVAALIAQWRRRNQQIKSATKMDFSEQINQFRKAGVSMGEAIKNGFQSAQVGKWFDNWVRATFPEIINRAVREAIAEWKRANPPPVRPSAVPQATLPPSAKPGNQRGTGTQTNTQTNDNSKNITVQVALRGDSAQTAREKQQAREVAFAVATMSKAWF